jgi:hypothetical protein
MEKIENKNLLFLIRSGQEIYKEAKYVKKPPMKNGLSSIRPFEKGWGVESFVRL